MRRPPATVKAMTNRRPVPDGAFKATATYGQEFVIEESEQAEKWAKNLIIKNIKEK